MVQPLPKIEAINPADLRDAVITFVPQAGAFFVGRAGGPDELFLADGSRLTRFSAALAAMYLGVGPGVHRNSHVHRESGLHVNSYEPNRNLIAAGLVPEDIARVTEQDRAATHITFGRFAIASREATEEDRGRVRTIRDAFARRQLALLQEVDVAQQT